MKIEPMSNRLLIRVLPQDEMSAGGVHIPATAAETEKRATVLAVGPGRRGEDGELVPMTVEVGDVVVFMQFAGFVITHEGEELRLLCEDEVWGRVVE